MNDESPIVIESEPPLVAFISSTMRSPQLMEARRIAVKTIKRIGFMVPWAFEFTPASSEQVSDSYLKKVREADFVIWLVGEETTEPVANEIKEALASRRRLLIFRLPANRRSDATEQLIKDVGHYAKYDKVDRLDELSTVISAALGDEIARALRIKPRLSRVARLTDLYNASRARCMARWQALGVNRSLASVMADDDQIGSSGIEVERSSVTLLLGPMGVGKSLTAERVFQRSLHELRERATAPVPVFIHSSQLQQPLDQFVLSASTGLGDPQTQGAFVIVDGIDERGIGWPSTVLTAARELVNRWDSTTVVLTSRPMPELQDAEEVQYLDFLSPATSAALVHMISDRPTDAIDIGDWPESVRELASVPFFAILIGQLIARGDLLPDSANQADLIQSLVDHALLYAGDQSAIPFEMLSRLAAMSVDRGNAPVLAAEVGSSRDIALLVATGLVMRNRTAVWFSHAAILEWFAAQCVVSGSPTVEALLRDRERLSRWMFPLSFLISTSSYESASSILMPIASHAPGLAGTIIRDVVARTAVQPDERTLTSIEHGTRLLRAFDAWMDGMSMLGEVIGPWDDEGSILPLAIKVRERSVVVAWKLPSEHEPAVSDLGSIQDVFDVPRTGLVSRQSSPKSSNLLWPWEWSFSWLRRELRRAIDHWALQVDHGPLASEYAWSAALTILNRGSHFQDDIPMSIIESALQKLGDADAFRRGSRTIALHPLRNRIAKLKVAGKSALQFPWPREDRVNNGWVWGGYSDDRLLEYVEAVYSAGIQGYLDLVDVWLPKFRPDLPMVQEMPFRVVGRLSTGNGSWGGPSLSTIRFLNRGDENVIDINLSRDTDTIPRWEHDPSYWDGGLESLAPRFKGPIPTLKMDQTINGKMLVGWFGARPATKLAYSFLFDDLSRLGWIDGMQRQWLVDP